MDTLTDRFQGCLVGGLLGDCFGAPFEHDHYGLNRHLTTQTFFENLLQDTVKPGPQAGANYRFKKGMLLKWLQSRIPFFNSSGNDDTSFYEYVYTDDTAMGISLGESLVAKEEFDEVDLAKRFVEEYFRCSDGYGGDVGEVFKKLLDGDFKDVYQPSQQQFGGQGSYGNGAAMRVAPVALFYKDNLERLKQVAELQGKITHANPTGYNAGVLQALAVHKALHSDPDTPLDAVKFVDELYEAMKSVEGDFQEDPRSLARYMDKIRKIFAEGADPSPSEICSTLGNNVRAHRSIPTAIYCFLRGERPLQTLQHDSPVLRTIYFAVCVGGDTDTIACMAASISGARHGMKAIPDVLPKHCFGAERVTQIAKDMAKIVHNRTQS